MSVWPEERLQEHVRRCGGCEELELAVLLEGFGVRRPSDVSLRDVTSRMREVGITADPPLSLKAVDGRVTLRLDETNSGGANGNGSSRAGANGHPAANGHGAGTAAARPKRKPLAPSPPPRPRAAATKEVPTRERRRAADSPPPPGEGTGTADSPLPASTVEPDGEASSRARRSLRRYNAGIAVLGIAGSLALAEGIVTTVWQEPFSYFQAKGDQDDLRNQLRQTRLAAIRVRAADRAQLAEVNQIKDRRVARKRRLFLFARALRAAVPSGSAIGTIVLPSRGVSKVIVAGTGDRGLRRGPGHYEETLFPGQGGTVGIAGHRTTYGAPFRDLDKLQKNDRILLDMPYGRFTYRVTGTKIFPASAEHDVFDFTGKERLVLSACHPRFSDAQRIVVFARLTGATPLGAAKDPPRQAGSGDRLAPVGKLGSRDLKEGMEGDDVRALQSLLGLDVDGRFGPATTTALKSFQTINRLRVTGVVDDRTRSLLLKRGRSASREADVTRGVPATPPEAPPPPKPRKPGENGQGQGGSGSGSGSSEGENG